MTNEIRITHAGEDETLSYRRYVEFEYDGETYTGWIEWDSNVGSEWIPVYGDYEALFNKTGSHVDALLIDNLSYDLQQGVTA